MNHIYVDPIDVLAELRSSEARDVFNMVNSLGPRWHYSANQNGMVVLNPEICIFKMPPANINYKEGALKPSGRYEHLQNPYNEHARTPEESIIGLKRAFVHARKQGDILVVNRFSEDIKVYQCEKDTGVIKPSHLSTLSL